MRRVIVELQRLNARLDVIIFVIIAVFAAPALGLGQWVHYPTAGVPRKADGAPDLTAPAPRLPRTWGMPHLTKAIHTPRLLVLLYEVNAMYRQIFIDGRPLLVDPNPSWNGYSTATWDRDTLVIQTTGFRDDLWIDMNGAPLTGAGKMTERLRRPNYGTLEVEITVDDPKAYTRPWTVSIKEGLEVDTELIDEICLENEKSWQHMQAAPPVK
jgi:hypothetical protein